ncbi:hypothetical protein [Breznakiella homolactica]|uniref:Uncharacterized protein n=1 Tax=Breznakiella homolactica TaxID=2798577 RepID=A0A7T8BCL8_9SPIR|nr:hypothetical protein [Breznakiella homolactica]QQO11255.1 hypothetical protein JFL75_10205 [Breznakiella homolactica]
MKYGQLAAVIAAGVLLVSSCSFRDMLEKRKNGSSQGNEPAQELFQARWFSYDSSSAVPVFSLPAIRGLDDPFPEEAIFGDGFLAVRSGSRSTAILGTIPAENAEISGTAVRETVRARSGKTLYSIRDGRLEVREVFGDSSSGTRESGSVDPAPEGKLLRTWDHSYMLTAGPLILGDFLILASARPSFLILNRNDLTVDREIPGDYLAAGPLVYIPGYAVMAAFHGNGTIGLYAADPPVPAGEDHDPVAALIEPNASALREISVRAKEFFSIDGDASFGPVTPYVSGITVPPEGAALYLLPVNEEPRQYRVYISGPEDMPFGIMVFDETGGMRASNVEYEAARFLDITVPGRTRFYAAAGFFATALGNGAGKAYPLVVSPFGETGNDLRP